MASSSASSTTNSLSKTSRFSTSLKVFKFASKDKDSRPPPLPPKDSYYLKNRSLASLSPDTLSVPNSPLSPHSPHSRRLSPEMNQSSMSLVSSAASARSGSPADHISQKPMKKERSGFFKFAKRSPKAPSTKSPPALDATPPPPQEDENISMPWNFQHNIHVDEGFTGLPPSWTTSLTKAGFTEEEIADIQQRRTAGTRSPGSQYLFTDRPASPAYSVNPPILTRPTPRTTSLPRQYADGSMIGSTEGGPRSPPPLPTQPLGVSSPPRTLPLRQYSTDQGSTHHHHPSASTHSLSSSIDSHISNGSMSFGQDAALRALGTTSPSRAAETAQPSTPPRRTYRITNDIPINSPPPSYTHFGNGNGSIYLPDRKDGSSFDQSSQTSHTSSAHSTPRSNSTLGASSSISPDTTPQRYQRPRAGTDTSHDRTPSTASNTDQSPQSDPRLRADSRSKRLTALPPRLSLHKASDSTDLSTWGEALLSGMSTASAETTPNSSTFAAAQDARLQSTSSDGGRKLPQATPTNTLYYERAEAATRAQPAESKTQARENKPTRQPPPTRPIPPIVLGNGGGQSAFDSDEDEDAPSSSWVEAASTARYDPSATSWDEPERSGSGHGRARPPADVASPLWGALDGMVRDEPDKEDEVYSAALSESQSPTLPFSPNNSRRGEDIIKGRRPVPLGDENGDEGNGLLRADEGERDRTNRDSSRSSTSTVMGLAEPVAIVRNVSIARRAGAYVIDKSKVGGRDRAGSASTAPRPSPPATSSVADSKHPPSPLSSNFGSEEGSASGSGSSSSLSQDHQTPVTDVGMDSPLLYYLDSSPSPDPSKLSFSPSPHHRLLVSTADTFGGIKEEEANDDFQEEDEDEEMTASTNPLPKPKIVISGAPSITPLTSIATSTTPLSPFQRYRGWLSAVVAPLEEFIDEAVDPRDYYLDLHEIAEGESGSVFAARLAESNLHKLKLPPLVKAHDSDDLANGRTTLVAIKSVAILPSGSPKLIDLERELTLMKGLWHDNVLSMDAVYVDLVEDTLWIRMELMERSLADIIGLVGEGLMLQDRMIARFASDVLQALEYLQKQRIAHRDVRSDNLLLNRNGILKLTDFSNAVRVTRESPMRSDPVGVVYWQAPEVRTPPYNALQIDVWSLGATVWEMAEAEPPFADTQQIGDRWPPLSKPQLYSPAFHDFLTQCSEPASSRPTPSELKKTPFINNASGRPVIIQLLAQCMAIEQTLQEEASQGSISE